MNRIEIENRIKDVILSDEKLLQPNKIICYEAKYKGNASTTSIYYKDDVEKKELELELELLVLITGIYKEEYSNQLSTQFLWNTVIIEINMDGTYKSQYLYDVEKVKADELITAQDFSASLANHLVNHYLFVNVKFKRKFERIIWIFWVEKGLPYFELYSINKRNQKLPIELDDEYSDYAKKTLLHHYEVTQNGILKDVWKPWNKIIISIPPNGYLNENEDIVYYLDDVKLEKDFFLRGY
jgi:hypothetical protein